jgi:hypothetical protein
VDCFYATLFPNIPSLYVRGWVWAATPLALAFLPIPIVLIYYSWRRKNMDDLREEYIPSKDSAMFQVMVQHKPPVASKTKSHLSVAEELIVNLPADTKHRDVESVLQENKKFRQKVEVTMHNDVLV